MFQSGFRSLGLALALIAFLIVFQLCTFTVSESEQVVLTRFGAPHWTADHGGGTAFSDPVHHHGQSHR